MYKITATFTLEEQFLLDVLTTAVEGHYDWFAFWGVKRHREEGPKNLCVYECGALELDCDGAAPGDADWVLSKTPITLASIAQAIEKILAGGLINAESTNTLFGACAENDASNVDMDLADCIMQVACFNELRYG